jgi:hypothetical protein
MIVTRLVIIALAVLALRVNTVAAADDDGVRELHQVVEQSCRCGLAQRSGMAAALTCTQGPQDFGRLKVQFRAGWDEPARKRVAALEQIIEYCLSHAIGASQARDRLGQPPTRADGSLPPVYWLRLQLAQLVASTSDLIRIRDRHGNTRAGMVVAKGDGQIRLRHARRDGGGTETIVTEDIRDLWILELNARQ